MYGTSADIATLNWISAGGWGGCGAVLLTHIRGAIVVAKSITGRAGYTECTHRMLNRVTCYVNPGFRFSKEKLGKPCIYIGGKRFSKNTNNYI